MGKDSVPRTQKMPEIKDHIVHCYGTYKSALYAFLDFKKEHESDIVRCDKTESIAIAFMNDTTLHYFMSKHRYESWCKGRTYTMYGKKMHSGYEVQ